MVDPAEIHRKARSDEVEERTDAVSLLRDNFADLPDKEEAWEDLHQLTGDEDDDVRWGAMEVLGSVFQHIPDKEQAQKDLHQRIGDKHSGVRRGATYSLGTVFPYVPDKEQAQKDLHQRTSKNEDDADVRWFAARALGSVFQHVPDKKQAWGDLIWLTEDEDKYVRLGAADALGSAFQHALDKEDTWNDLHRLTGSEDVYVQLGASGALGSAFQHVPDKKRAWDDLIRLTRYEDKYVRASANHSLGRASIFKATEVERSDDFKSELKNAIQFFERSLKETDFNPSEFCLPFYKLFHAITFEGAGADKVQKYLVDAKSASEGSRSKETLIKAAENLANALTECQKERGVDLDTIKSDLNAYRQYGERATDLIGSAEENAPETVQVLRRVLPIIDDRIKEPLKEVKKKAEIVCKTAVPSESKLACRIEQDAVSALATDNPVLADQLINHILIGFERWSRSIPDENKREYVQESIFDTKNGGMVGKLLTINSLMPIALTFPKDGGKDMSKYEIKNSVVTIAEGDRISQSIQSSTTFQKDLSQNNAETHKKSEEPKKNTVPFRSDLESEICDIFKSVYLKERKEDVSEVNSKTLEFLKYKLLDLAASGKRIDWLDVGCGDGRCLDVLEAVQNIENIRYHGTDSLYRYLDDTEERARKYGMDARLDKIDAAAMKFDSEYDVVSAVLLLHEVDPLCLPYILRNMLQALKGDGTLIIADFQGPYEQEGGVVAWGAEDIRNLLEKIGEAKMSIEFMPSSQYPDELGFYRCYVKKSGLDREKFSDLLQGYDSFLDAKKEESKRKRGELRSQIKERVRKLLNRSDIDPKNISHEEMQRIQTGIGDEYGVKAHKIRLLTSQIEFLDDKITEFRSGVGCDGADQHAL